MATAARETGGINTPAYTAAVARIIRQEIDGYPFAVIANDIRSYKASAETIGEGRILGSVKDVLQATLDKTGSLSSDLAPSLINARYALETLLPLKQTLTDTYTAYLKANEVAKADIWAKRNVTLPAQGAYTPVRVAVWDSGVDTALFPKQLLKDAKGKTALLAYDLDSRPSNTELFPIPSAVQPRLPTLLARTKGFSDLQSNIDSPEASAVKQFMSTLKPEEFKPTLEELGLAGNYVHGTHVAGIVTAGNPWVQLAIARISFDYKLTPDPCPSRELSERSARANHAWVDWFRKNRIRVVNMSWGGTAKGNEDALERCGIGKTPEERQKLAREYFDIEKKALYTAFASAPEVLFITAAGNSNSDASFDEAIPSSLSLPNLLTVGAVDQAGDEAPFTSYGPTVVVHANGYQVESFLPGGKRVALSGTSMASPNVANLAAKMLARKPSLKPTEVIAIIRATADKTSDGRRTLINPQKAMARLD
jgi:subtilisin family serine protease